MTYYVVSDALDKEPDRLVVAPNVAQAIRHVAKRYSAKVASSDALASMLTDGKTKIEHAKEDATQASHA